MTIRLARIEKLTYFHEWFIKLALTTHISYYYEMAVKCDEILMDLGCLVTDVTAHRYQYLKR